MGAAELVTLGLAILGVAGIIFTALKYNRDDTTAIVNQQSTLVHDMEVITAQLRAENDRLQHEVDRLSGVG